MQVYIFRTESSHYGFTDERAGAHLPADHGPWSYMEVIDLEEGESIPRFFVSADEVLSDIKAKGHFVKEIPLRPKVV